MFYSHHRTDGLSKRVIETTNSIDMEKAIGTKDTKRTFSAEDKEKSLSSPTEDLKASIRLHTERKALTSVKEIGKSQTKQTKPRDIICSSDKQKQMMACRWTEQYEGRSDSMSKRIVYLQNDGTIVSSIPVSYLSYKLHDRNLIIHNISSAQLFFCTWFEILLILSIYLDFMRPRLPRTQIILQ